MSLESGAEAAPLTPEASAHKAAMQVENDAQYQAAGINNPPDVFATPAINIDTTLREVKERKTVEQIASLTPEARQEATAKVIRLQELRGTKTLDGYREQNKIKQELADIFQFHATERPDYENPDPALRFRVPDGSLYNALTKYDETADTLIRHASADVQAAYAQVKALELRKKRDPEKISYNQHWAAVDALDDALAKEGGIDNPEALRLHAVQVHREKLDAQTALTTALQREQTPPLEEVRNLLLAENTADNTWKAIAGKVYTAKGKYIRDLAESAGYRVDSWGTIRQPTSAALPTSQAA